MELSHARLKEIRDTCRVIPGDDGWWKTDNKITFVTAGIAIAEAGIEIEQVIDMLAALYFAVAAEFGG